MKKKQAKPGLIVAAAIGVMVGLALLLSFVSSVYLKASFRSCDPLTDIYCIGDKDVFPPSSDLPIPGIEWRNEMDPSPLYWLDMIPPIVPNETPIYGYPNYDLHDSPGSNVHETESSDWITPIDS